jgi:NADPH2:quinone reductase
MEGGATVKAIVVAEGGGPEKLVLADVPDPTPAVGELIVQVSAAGLNFIDTYQRGGLYPMDFPFTPGLEGAGVVVEVGESVDDFSIGDRVGWTSVIGSYAEKHAVPADAAIPIPEAVDEATTAAMLLQGVTAHYLATDTYSLARGDRCLIHAGAGGVGLLLTQIAKLYGAEVVTTVGTDQKAQLSKDAGSDHVVVYTRENFKDAIEDAYGPHPLDVIYDGVGAATFEDSLDLLRPRGMMVTFGNASGPVPAVSPLTLAQKGSLFLTRPTMTHYLQTREELLGRANALFEWIADGHLNVRVGAEYPLEQASDAHRALEGRQTTGKVLLEP